MAEEWFRRTGWSPGEAAAFRARLLRAPPGARAQYLRIQAGHLLEAGLAAPALSLLDEMLATYPDPIELSAAEQQCGRCLVALQRTGEAIDAFRRAVGHMRTLPNVRNLAWLDMARLVAVQCLRAHFGEALDLLEAFDGDARFPVDRFERHGYAALILAEQGHREAAGREARAALAAADATHSGFHNHPRLGLVGEEHAPLRQRLKLLAA